MKKTYLALLALTICSTFSFAQNKLSKLKSNETGIVFASFPVLNLNNYQENTNSVYSFYQAYKMISENDLQNRFSSLNALKTQYKTSKQNNTVALAILNSDFEVIKPEALTNNKIRVNSDGFLVENANSKNIYTKNSISILAPLQANYKGLNVIFNLSENNIFNTTSKEITTIKIDFGNNNGFKTIAKNENISIIYSEKGNKTITSILEFSDGSSVESKSTINIKYSNTDLVNRFRMTPITFTSQNTTAPNLSPYGVANDIGTGEYDIFLSADNVLDKPIFIVDGFDPGDSRDIIGIYDLLNFNDNGTTSNLGDLVRAEGFDIVVLNFPVYTRASDNVEVDGGSDFIERNAMLLTELINIINTQKIGTEKNVIIGPSMGGLISRYALNFMESQNLNHDTRLWLSFDSPHNGANVPIGFQHLFNYMAYGLDLGGIAGDQSIEALRPIVDGMLKSPAAKQMLVDHFVPHLANGSNVDFNTNLKLPIKHPWNSIFFNGLNNLTTSGFPENLRKISMINGSGIGNPYQDKTGGDILPNREVLDVTIEDVAFQTDATFKVKYTPYSGQQSIVSYLFIDAIWFCFCDLEEWATVEAEAFSNGVDAASGGLFDIGALSGSLGTDPLITAFFNALQTDYFNFIPSVSSMALENDGEIDWFHVPTGLTTARTVSNITPFDAWYMPDDNENHVTLTPQNVTFAWDEIVLNTLDVETFNDDFIKIDRNPIQEILSISSSKTFKNTSIFIIDVTGKVVYNTSRTISDTIKIPLNIASGLYILSIETNENYSFKTKIVKQ